VITSTADISASQFPYKAPSWGFIIPGFTIPSEEGSKFRDFIRMSEKNVVVVG
jgi:hypothetical protein